MTNAIDWLRETAAYLVWDRPDVYDHETAVEELSVAMDTLREAPPGQEFAAIMFTSYVLMRIYIADDDGQRGVEEFVLTRKLSSLIVFEAERQVAAYSYIAEIDLPDPLDSQEQD